MNKAISIEVHFFLISVLWGAIILLVYDALRILRRLIGHNSFFIALEDLIFWVIASLFIFSMIYRLNDGIIRGFSVMGIGIGMVLYHYILSDFIVKVITGAIRLLFKPLILFGRLLKKISIPIFTGFKHVIIFPFTGLKKCIKSVKITNRKHRQKRKVKRKVK